MSGDIPQICLAQTAIKRINTHTVVHIAQCFLHSRIGIIPVQSCTQRADLSLNQLQLAFRLSFRCIADITRKLGFQIVQLACTIQLVAAVQVVAVCKMHLGQQGHLDSHTTLIVHRLIGLGHLDGSRSGKHIEDVPCHLGTGRRPCLVMQIGVAAVVLTAAQLQSGQHAQCSLAGFVHTDALAIDLFTDLRLVQQCQLFHLGQAERHMRHIHRQLGWNIQLEVLTQRLINQRSQLGPGHLHLIEKVLQRVNKFEQRLSVL